MRDIEIACTFACFVPHLHHHSLIHQRAARGKFLVCPARPCSCRSSTLLTSISSALASRPAFLDVARRRSRRRRDARWSPRRPRARWFSSPRSNFFSSPRTRARTSRCTATGWLLRLNSPPRDGTSTPPPVGRWITLPSSPGSRAAWRSSPPWRTPACSPSRLSRTTPPRRRCSCVAPSSSPTLSWRSARCGSPPRPATDLRAPPLVPASPPARSSSSSSSSAPVF